MKRKNCSPLIPDIIRQVNKTLRQIILNGKFIFSLKVLCVAATLPLLEKVNSLCPSNKYLPSSNFAPGTVLGSWTFAHSCHSALEKVEMFVQIINHQTRQAKVTLKQGKGALRETHKGMHDEARGGLLEEEHLIN